MKKALVLAGGFPQIALIEELHKRGYQVLLADYNKEPVAKKYADKYYQVSTLDLESIEKIAREERVNFLITVCTDQALNTVSYVAEKLGLPCYIDHQTGLNVTNKAYMKGVFRNNDIPTADFCILDTLDLAKITKLHYPLIVKPVDCNSSKGVKKVFTNDELKEAFDIAISLSRTNNVVVEEYIEGQELSIDVYVENGHANVLCITQIEKIKSSEKFIIFRGLSPAGITDDISKQICMVAQKIVDAFEIKNSPMLIQLISNGNSVKVLEFSARTGGGVKYLQIKRMTGFDVISAVVDLTIGIKPHYSKKETGVRYLTNEFIYCHSGKYEKMEGLDDLKSKGVISDYYEFKWKGAEFGEVLSSGDRVAGFTIEGNSLEELSRKHDMVALNVRVINDKGEDFMNHELLAPIEI